MSRLVSRPAGNRRFPLRGTLLGLELFIGGWAVYGAVMLATDAWHLPVADLAPLPLHSWVLPGVGLLLVVAVPMLVAAALQWRHARRAAGASLAAGVLLVSWIAVQVAVIGPQMWLQPLMLVAGLATAALAWWGAPNSPVHRRAKEHPARAVGPSRRQAAAMKLWAWLI